MSVEKFGSPLRQVIKKSTELIGKVKEISSISLSPQRLAERMVEEAEYMAGTLVYGEIPVWQQAFYGTLTSTLVFSAHAIYTSGQKEDLILAGISGITALLLLGDSEAISHS